MRAIAVTSLDGPNSVELLTMDDPAPGPDEVLIRVRAAGASFPDALQTRGLHHARPALPYVMGSEVAGVVVQAPQGSGFLPGDRVAAFCVYGGFAELVCVASDRVFPIPHSMSFAKAAALPLNYLTSWFGLVERGNLRPGESVLVQGAAGGVGTASIQIARAIGAERIVAVVSTDAKGAAALEVGASEYVLVKGFKDEVLANGKVDVVVDPVGGSRFTDSLRCLAEGGRLLVVGYAEGEIPLVKVNRLLLGNTSVVGVGWGAYSIARPGHMAGEWRDMYPHLLSGVIDPLIDTSYSLIEASDALLAIEERRAVGKIVLSL